MMGSIAAVSSPPPSAGEFLFELHDGFVKLGHLIGLLVVR
jgi:hypothetical protein